MTTTENIETGHLDRVTVVNINFDGSMLLTASIDHRVKVWNVNRATGDRKLVETFTAHDADIRDAKWLHPSTGTHLGTVGNDLKFHLWQEDPHQAPNSGRRFRRIHTIPSKHRVPFVSLDFKNVENVYTYLALIDRQGLLSVYEPTNPDEFKDWTLVDQFHVCNPPPSRGEQACFKVRFDQNVTPSPYINCLSDDRRQLSLVVTAMNEVKIYRSVVTPHQESFSSMETGDAPSANRESSHAFMFYEAARLPAHPALVRDVQWAPFNIRGSDMFATACRDGAVRIFEISVSENTDHSRGPHTSRDRNSSYSRGGGGAGAGAGHNVPPRQQPQQSSLTNAITSRNQTNNGTSNAAPPPPPSQATLTSEGSNLSTTDGEHQRNTHRFPYTHNIAMVADLTSAHDDAWAIAWESSGQVLISSGADGTSKIWRRSILDAYQQGLALESGDDRDASSGRGRWMLFADQAVDFGPSVGEDSDEASDY